VSDNRKDIATKHGVRGMGGFRLQTMCRSASSRRLYIACVAAWVLKYGVAVSKYVRELFRFDADTNRQLHWRVIQRGEYQEDKGGGNSRCGIVILDDALTRFVW